MLNIFKSNKCKSFLRNSISQILFFRISDRPIEQDPSFYLSNLKLFAEKSPEYITELFSKEPAKLNTNSLLGNFFPQLFLPQLKLFWKNFTQTEKDKFLENVIYFSKDFESDNKDDFSAGCLFLKKTCKTLIMFEEYMMVLQLAKVAKELFTLRVYLLYISCVVEYCKNNSSSIFYSDSLPLLDYLETLFYDYIKIEEEISYSDFRFVINLSCNFTHFYCHFLMPFNEKSLFIVDFLLNVSFNELQSHHILTIYNNIFLLIKFKKLKLKLKNEENLEFIEQIIEKWIPSHFESSGVEKMVINEDGICGFTKRKIEMSTFVLNKFLQSFICEHKHIWKHKLQTLSKIAEHHCTYPFEQFFIDFYCEVISQTDFQALKSADKITAVKMIAQIFKNHTNFQYRLKVIKSCHSAVLNSNKYFNYVWILKTLKPFASLMFPVQDYERTKFVNGTHISIEDQTLVTKIIRDLHSKLVGLESSKANLENLLMAYFGIVGVYRLSSLSEIRTSNLHLQLTKKLNEPFKLGLVADKLLMFFSLFEVWKDKEIQHFCDLFFVLWNKNKYFVNQLSFYISKTQINFIVEKMETKKNEWNENAENIYSEFQKLQTLFNSQKDGKHKFETEVANEPEPDYAHS